MEKVKSKVAVVVDGKVVFENFADWTDACHELLTYFETHPEQAGKSVEFFNYVQHVSSEAGDFNLVDQGSDLYLGDENIYNGETKYTIEGYYGEEFYDESEVEAFLLKEYRAGKIDLEEIQNVNVRKEYSYTVTFDDADLEDPEYVMELSPEGEDIVKSFGATYVPASEVTENTDNVTVIESKQQEPLYKDLKEFSDAELQVHLHAMRSRMDDIIMEQLKREHARQDLRTNNLMNDDF